MMHHKSQQIDPFGIGLDLKLINFPGEFYKTGPKLAGSV
jgi:hypothetical protein